MLYNSRRMPIRVLLADDSEVMRKAVVDLLHSDPEIEVVAESASFAQTIQLKERGSEVPHEPGADAIIGLYGRLKSRSYIVGLNAPGEQRCQSNIHSAPNDEP